VPDLPSLPYAGTGFVVGPDLMMTNRHVAQIFSDGIGTKRLNFQSGQSAAVDFYRENGLTESEVLNVERVEMIHPYWDMALLRVKGLPAGRPPLALSVADPAGMTDREVVVVGYPGYDPTGDAEFQRIQDRVFRGTYYVKRLQPGVLRVRRPVESYDQLVEAVTHDASTLGGNSGSAVLVLPQSPQEPLQVVGLHFAGAYLEANYAVPTADLAQDSRIVDTGVNFVRRVEPRDDFYGPYWQTADTDEAAEASRAPPPPPQVAAVSYGGIEQQPAAAGATKWIIPLEVSVTVGQLRQSAQPVAAATVQAIPKEGLFDRRPSEPTARLHYPFSADSLFATRFDWRTALSLALASRLSYEDIAAIQATVAEPWKMEGSRFIELDDTQCFVASTPQNILVAFRGTESAGDWLIDLDVAGSSRPYGDVHRGFLRAFQAVEPLLLMHLAELPNRALVLTGHSLGGALATVAAAEWAERFNIAWVMTYGQPAVGKAKFGSWMQRYASNLIRIVNDDDIVTRVPPTYGHVGRLIHFDARGNIGAGTETLATSGRSRPHQAPGDEAMLDEAEFDRLRALLLQQRAQRRVMGSHGLEAPVAEGIIPSLSDHSLDAYIAKIATKLSSRS
jgi:V8-like Glu-specific endopeptidase